MQAARGAEQIRSVVEPSVADAGFDLDDLVVSPAGKRRLEASGRTDTARLLNELRDRPSVVDATILGQSVHCLVDEQVDPLHLGLTGCRVRPVEPSLEDVFVALVRARNRE